jgi:acetyl-CoA carboxylase carboxyl transferase subunit alpha
MATQRELTPLEFERPLRELEKKIEELRGWTREQTVDLRDQICQLEQKLEDEKQAVYGNLSAWERVLIARHPQRPYFLDFVQMMMTDFIELHGDRLFADDRAMVGGIARLGNHRVMLVATQKGRDTKERTMRNFGMPHPEGYRKALRLMQMAEKFHIPTIAFIDTPGAYPGIGAEERGVSQAIAFNLREMMRVRTPMIVLITGEGCSGGAIGIGVGDIVLILQHAYYSVITPEGCAAILWRDAGQMAKAAATMKLTSEDLLKHRIVDEVLPEPLGGCHGQGATARPPRPARHRQARRPARAPLPEVPRARRVQREGHQAQGGGQARTARQRGRARRRRLGRVIFRGLDAPGLLPAHPGSGFWTTPGPAR